MPEISVLMPAYNAEQFVEKAIKSVIEQSFRDWELIIIDDCSSDNTGRLCDLYSFSDTRIKVFHMAKNCGISEAKNRALDKATGGYIAFCDDDDIMEIDALKDNLELAKKWDADIVRWSYKTIKVDETNEITDIIERKCESAVYNNRKAIFEDYKNVHTMLSCDWTALYKRNYISENNIRFNTNFKYGGEDTLFNIMTLNNVNKMIMNSKMYYNWYLRKKHSTTTKRDINFCYSMMEVAKKEHEVIMNNCINGKEIWVEYEEFYRKLILDYSKRLSYEENELINIELNRKKW